LSAVDRPSAGRIRRVAQGLAREGLYYPLLLERRARRAGADLVHCTHAAPAVTRRLPLVVTVHDLLPLRFPRLFPRATVVHTRASLRVVRSAHRILTNSEHTRAEVLELLGVPPERVTATPFGIEARFRPLQSDPDWLLRRFGLRAPYLLAVGTLEPRKNLEGVLRAFDLLAPRFPGLSLAVVGGKGWRDGMLDSELRRPREDVVATGFVDDDELVRLYSAAACFVFPSLAEGFGFPPLEAMACGAPVVTSDRPALPEVVGDAALLTDPTHPEAIATAVERVLSSPQLVAELRARGRARAAGFTWRSCAERTAAAYAEVLDDPGRA
ncbi:MAG TPA: glycosyltransferase family 1 protein, partial [Thermoleophilaceae bacterium]|nr:glycosyltransferase family 1 protein [Thermoleophilaceae bacterium]